MITDHPSFHLEVCACCICLFGTTDSYHSWHELNPGYLCIFKQHSFVTVLVKWLLAHGETLGSL